MFCPNCGKESLDDRRFCSTCGTNLQMVKQAVTGNLSSPMPKIDIPANLLPDAKRKKFKAAGFVSMGLGILYMMTMAIVSEMVGDINWRAGQILENLVPLGALLFITGILIMIYGRIMYKRDDAPQVIIVNPQQMNPQQMNQQPVQNPPLSAPLNQPAISAGEHYNPPYTYPPSSVTEHTTAELKRPPESIKVRR